MSRRGGDPRGGGTSAWLTAVRERTFSNVTEKFLMMTLCDYINGADECWPGNVTLAPEIGVDPRTIKRTLARLEEAGVISRYKRQRTDGRGRATDVIVFLWQGFQSLPLVHSDADQGDTLSTDQEDIEDRPRGHSDTGPRGHSGTPSSFRTPQLEPPHETPVVAGKRRRIPDPFIVTAKMQEWASEKFPAVDWRVQTEQFKDHHQGNGTTKLDWEATWRTWIRNAGTKYAPRQNGTPRLSNVEKSWRNIQEALG